MNYFFSCVLILFLTSCRLDKSEPTLGPKPTQKDLKSLSEPPAQKPRRKKTATPLQTIKEEIPASLLKPISLSLSGEISLKETLLALSKQAKVDLSLDKNLDIFPIYSVTQKPLIEVLEDLCDLGELKLTRKGTSVKIQPDRPYSRNYNIQFLNLNRSAQTQVSIATDVFSNTPQEQAQNKSIGDNGSSSRLDMKTSNDFWAELQQTLDTVMLQEKDKKASYALHKQAGIISVFGTSRCHEAVDHYIKQLKQVVATQVLIEAKVIEVTLSDQYRSGINWTKVQGGDLRVGGSFADLARSSDSLYPTQSSTDYVSFGLTGKTFSTILQSITTFGTAKTLSSPRLTVLNNQTAILKVAQNQVYFKLNYDRNFYANSNRETTSVSSEIQTVPIGLVMAVQPSIDQDTGKIILSLRPTISRFSESVRDPAVDIALANSSNTSITSSSASSVVPVVEVREIDSVLSVQDGEIAVLGGFLEVRSRYTNQSLPVLSKVPLIGELVKGTNDGDEVVELVILLKVSIVDQSPPSEADERLVSTHISDPRPF